MSDFIQVLQAAPWYGKLGLAVLLIDVAWVAAIVVNGVWLATGRGRSR